MASTNEGDESNRGRVSLSISETLNNSASSSLDLSLSSEEYNIYLTGLIPSQFIYALDTRDMSAFKTVLWMSSVTVISVSIVSPPLSPFHHIPSSLFDFVLSIIKTFWVWSFCILLSCVNFKLLTTWPASCVVHICMIF